MAASLPVLLLLSLQRSAGAEIIKPMGEWLCKSRMLQKLLKLTMCVSGNYCAMGETIVPANLTTTAILLINYVDRGSAYCAAHSNAAELCPLFGSTQHTLCM